MSNDNMAELFEKFSNMIKDDKIPDDMKSILSSLSSNASTSENTTSNESNSSIDFETLLKMKSIMESLNTNNDPGSRLLLSLKPYLKESRKEKVDQYIKLFGMGKVLEVFGNFGGDSKK